MKTVLGNIIAIYRRELQSYFASPLAYGIAAVFWLLAGFLLVLTVFGPAGLLSQSALADQSGQAVPPIDLPYEFVRFYLGLLGSLSMFVLPMLSMGLYAEERKQGTLELLATSPVTNWVVALGKLLGVVTFYITMVLPLMVCEALILAASDPPFKFTILLLGHGGLILLAAGVLSLGLFVSSLTESTVLAAILTFALVLVLWVIDGVASAVPGPVGDAIGHLSLLTHYDDFIQGILDTSGLVLFLSYVVLGLFLTAQSIETLRFQRS
ncbi:MAG: ABC transporter permease [Leptolyngbya sp. SIO4C1]|nr:ABC transporter permease [Leptolyngbya sp. SIO4C1]